MIVHIVPCGLSILDNLQSGRARHDKRSERRIGGLVDWATDRSIHLQPASGWSHEFSEKTWLSEVASFASVDLSAECSSLFKDPRPPHWRRSTALPLPGDPVVLLASDTATGVLAALVNGVHLGRPIDFHQKPARDMQQRDGERILDGCGAPVHIITIPGLKPVHTDTFVTAMIEVGTALRWSMWWEPDEATILHLSGGYKAAIPYVTVFAEYMKRLDPDIRAFCLHEGDKSDASPDPIEIFLRRPDLDADRAELRAARDSEHDASKAPPPPRHLKGFAYEEFGDSRYTVTKLGDVLLAFFDLLPQ